MANEIVSIFDDVKTWFAKVFKNAPKDAAAALADLNTAAPYFEAVLAEVDPAAALIVDPIITVIQGDLGTVANMLATGNVTSVGTFLTAVKSNFAKLLTEGHITSATSVAKANAFLSIIAGLLATYAPNA